MLEVNIGIPVGQFHAPDAGDPGADASVAIAGIAHVFRWAIGSPLLGYAPFAADVAWGRDAVKSHPFVNPAVGIDHDLRPRPAPFHATSAKGVSQRLRPAEVEAQLSTELLEDPFLEILPQRAETLFAARRRRHRQHELPTAAHNRPRLRSRADLRDHDTLQSLNQE